MIQIEPIFYRSSDIQKLLGVSQPTASRIINKLKREYDIDEKRLPVSCCVPASILHDYYDFSDKLKKGNK